MLKIKKTDFRHRGAAPADARKMTREEVGTTSRFTSESSSKKSKVKRLINGMVSESAMETVTPSGTRMSDQTAIGVDLDPLLYNIAPGAEASLYRIYRDMYYVDPICGSAVDLMANMPFSDFTLGGIDPKHKKVGDTFMEVIETLGCKTLMPELSTDYLVMGQFTGSIIMNTAAQKFLYIMCHDSEYCKFDPLPFYGQDPIITVRFTKALQELLDKGDSKRIKKLKEHVGRDIFAKIAEGELELDPVSTIYVPRKSFSTTMGTSWFHRLLPIYLFEKNLYRGTLVESARRQRGILHVTLDGGDDWQPTPADFEYASELFTNADADPLGAIITTRSGIMTEEIRQGGDFWKITDVWDTTTQFKLKGLGIPEGLITGDGNVDTTSAGMTSQLESLRAFREMITRRFFYEKLFPLISVLNGYTVNNKGNVSIQEGLYGRHKDNIDAILGRIDDQYRLLIPKVYWNKHLKPEGDSTYLDMLSGLTEKGVPVPIRALAAAGGFNIEDLLANEDDDVQLRESIGEYLKRVSEVAKKFGPPADEEEQEASESAAAIALLGANPGSNIRSSVQKRGKISLAKRFESIGNDIVGRSKTGKPKLIINQARAQAKANDTIVKAVKDMKRKGVI